MKGASVLVTGANGFLGTHLCPALEANGYHVRRAVRGGHGDPIGDIGPSTDWSPLLDGVDCVVHLAAIAHRRDVPEAELERVNVAATRKLAADAAAAGVGRFVFLSSIAVLGDSSPVPVDEETTPDPRSPYARSKLAAEEAVAEAGGVTTVVLRPPAVLGHDAPGSVARMIRLIKSGAPLPVGALTARRSFVGVGNLVDAIVRSTEHPGAAGEQFVVSDGVDISTADLIERVAAMAGRKARLVTIPSSLLRLVARVAGRAGELDRLSSSLIVDATKLRTALQWDPPLGVDEVLADVARAIR